MITSLVMKTIFSLWKKRPTYFVVAILLILGAFLRFTNLNDHPSGLHNDEASFFFNAISLKTTGRDEDNRKWPLYINSFIDPKPALYSYLQIPFISLFGKTVTTSRLPAAILGTLSLLTVYLLCRELMDRKQAELILFLLVISPWHINLSRSTQEVIMSFFFSILAILSFLWFCKGKWRIPSAIMFLLSFGLAVYSYHSAKVFLPLTLLALFIFFAKDKRKFISYFLALGAVAGIIFWQISFGMSGGLTRFGQVSVFSQGNPQLILEEETRIATPYLPGILIRVFHNKIVNYGLEIGSKYFQHFTPDFLFFQGGAPARYSVPFHGLFYLIELPLLLYGLLKGLTNKEYLQNSYFFGVWLLISPLAAAVTTMEIPSVIRAFTMVLPILYFISIGITEAWSQEKKQGLILKAVVIVGYIWGISFFANQYLVQQPNYHPWARNYADQQLAITLKKYENQFETIRITRSISGDPYIYLALNGLIIPADLQNSYPARKEPKYSLGKYRFVTDECSLTADAKMLYVIPAYCEIPDYYTKLDIIRYKDNAAAYAIVQLNQALFLTTQKVKK